MAQRPSRLKPLAGAPPRTPTPITEVKEDNIKIAARSWLNGLARHYREMVDMLDPGEITDETHLIASRIMNRQYEFETEQGVYGATTPKEIARDEAEAALHIAGFEGDFSKATLDAMHKSMEKALDGYVQNRVAEMRGDPPPVPVPSSPLFLENIDAFIEEKETPSENHRGYKKHTSQQTRASFRLFASLLGNRPVREFTRKDANELRTLLLKVPQSFGKSARDVDARRAVDRAEAHDEPIRRARKEAPSSPTAFKKTVPRLTMKTVKRHFSSMAQYWEYLKRRNDVDENIFLGWPFPGTKSKHYTRDPWTKEDLAKLFGCDEWRSYGPLSAGHWFPLIALHSGMRLDEIAALRTVEDIEEERGVLVFKVQVQIPVGGEEYDPDAKKWVPKTMAGIRRIPVHSWLLGHGIRALIERRRREGAARLFPQLRPDKAHESFSADIGHEFSRLKARLKLGKRLVFHGFRITFRHHVSESLVSDEHLDAVTGHEGPSENKVALPQRHIDATVGTSSERGVGAMYERPRLYQIDVLRRVVEAFECPLGLSFLEPLDASIKAAPADKKNWAENRPRKPRALAKYPTRPKAPPSPMRRRRTGKPLMEPDPIR